MELARAAAAATEGQLARAQKQVSDLLSADPKDLDALVLRGEIELRAHQAASAVAAWKALGQREGSARAAYGLARAAFAAGDEKTAEAEAGKAIEKNPEHVGARLLLARIAAKKTGRENVALARLAEVAAKAELASPEERVNAHALLGDIHLGRSRISRAEEAYTNALKINPKAAHALIGLGEALYRAGRYSEAQARFEAGTQAEPDDLLAKVGVAKSKLMLERVEDALGSLKKLRESHPNSLLVAYWLGRAQDASGDRAQAEKTYRAAIDKTKDDPMLVDAYVALAQLQNQQGETDVAHKTLTTAQQRLPDSPRVYGALGDWSLSQGRYADAQREFQKALDLDGEDLGARFRLGTAYRRDGKLEE
ncbi:MAG TPA: tetratricopeptide repeat protein, partial [Polyangiales bacterium]|nr:tetratricopeptide repeat protein [Polyangiales bacterium]